MYGPCLTFGSCVPNEYTIQKYLWQLLDNDNVSFNIANHGVKNGHSNLNDFLYIFNTEIKPGDIIICMNVFSDIVSKNDMSFVGKTNILNQPEFNNVEKIKNLLNKFEDSSLFESVEEDDNDINIYIGKESKLDDDVTVIKTKYKTNTDEGTIAVIGPKRMEYDRVVSLLGYIKEHLK